MLLLWITLSLALTDTVLGLKNTRRGELTLDMGEHDTGKTLDAGDMSLNKLRSRRQSDVETDEFDSDSVSPAQRMTEEQIQFLQWYYRTEDPTSWKFGMLAFSFLGLLIGAMLIVMGMMANRNRKKIAKYKAATHVPAVKPDMEELQVIITEKKEDNNYSSASHHNNHRDWEEPLDDSKELSEELKPGEIVVTWKDGNISTLYPEPAAEGDVLNTEEEEEEERLSQNSPQVITSSETIAF